MQQYMINIYRQCGVVHVDDRIHILFIMSKKPMEKVLHHSFSDPIQIAHQHLLFLRISPFLCKYDYLNEIILTSCYSTQQHDYANYLHNIFACIIIFSFVPRIWFNYHTSHIRLQLL